MKTRIKKAIAIMAVLIGCTIHGKAQVEVMSNFIFAQDSIAGFDEPAARAGAMADGFFGKEYKVYMYRAQRTYIKQKYNLRTQPPITLFQNLSAARTTTVNGGACNNEDFELATSTIYAPSAVQGWSIQSGSNSNSCAPPTLNAVNLYTVYTSSVSDDRLPFTVSSYFDANSYAVPSGSAFIRMNDDNAGAKAVRMSKAFIPTPTSALFQYAYIAVIEDGGHPCCAQPGFNIKVTVTNTVTNTSTLLACPNISIAVPGAACQFTIPPGGPSFSPCVGPHGAGWTYCNWTTSALDLTQYINYMVQIDITVVDCSGGAHAAYFYVDAKCSPMVVTGNNIPFAAGTQSVIVPTCGAAGATICATPGLGPYSWAGPGVPAQYSIPSMTNQCYTSSLSATYTLYMQPPGSCAPIGRVVSTTITPAPLLLASIVQASCGGTAAVITLTPSGSAAVPSSITWSPPPLVVSSSTTVATYTAPPPTFTNVVTVTAVDPLGCQITQTLPIIPPAPYPTFSIVNSSNSSSITCTTPTVVLNTQSTYTYGTLTYFWSSNSYTATGNQANITNPGTYSCVTTDPATNCQALKVITIGVNTVAPLSTISPSFQNMTCNSSGAITVSLTASPSVNITNAILTPYGGSVSATSQLMTYVPACGVYTNVLTDNINGCVTTKLFTVSCSQGFPTFSVTSPQQFTLGCNSTSCAVINIVGGNTNPGGGAVSYTLLAPGNSSLTPPGALGPQSTYTVCASGMYTVITKDNSTFCETRLPISVLENTFAPNLSAVVPRTVLDCYTPSVTLYGVSTNTNAQYLWGFPGGTQQSDTIQVFPNPVATKTLANTFTLTITDAISTCRSTSVIPIYQDMFTPNAIISNGGTNAITCATPTIVLTNQSTTGIPSGLGFPNTLPAIASWTGPSPQDPQPNATTYTAQTVGIYTVSVQDLNNGCTSTATLQINDNRVYPNMDQTPATPVVLDCGVNQVAISPVISNPSPGMTYSWVAPPGATISAQHALVLSVNEPGEYSIIVLNTQNGCSNRQSIEVVNGALTAGFVPDHQSGYAPFTVHFTNTSASTNGTTNINSVWNFANGTSSGSTTAGVFVPGPISSSISPTAVYNQSGTYTVTMYAIKGSCLDTAQYVISVEIPSKMEIPNVFTPNGDGVNDFFFLKTSNLYEINARIFDRWGHVVYELNSTSGNISWDGKNQAGKDVAEGTYFYTITSSGDDGQKYNEKGTVSLYR